MYFKKKIFAMGFKKIKEIYNKSTAAIAVPYLTVSCF